MDREQRRIYEAVKEKEFMEITKNKKIKIEEFNFIAVKLLRLIQISSILQYLMKVMKVFLQNLKPLNK